MKTTLLIFSLVLATHSFAGLKVKEKDLVAFQCLSNLCQDFDQDQINTINDIIDRSISESNKNTEIAKSIIVDTDSVLNFDLLAKSGIEVIDSDRPMDFSMIKKESYIAPKNLEMDHSETLMGFRYKVSDYRHTYAAANVMLEKGITELDGTKATMSTIGFGSTVRNGWIVEIALLKNIREIRSAKFNPKPDGIYIAMRKRL